MLINCERNLKSERATSENEKSNTTHIATIATMLTTIYCVITLLSFKLKMRDFFFFLLLKMSRIIRSLLITLMFKT